MSDLLRADIKAVVMTSELNATHQITKQYQALLQFERILQSENWHQQIRENMVMSCDKLQFNPMATILSSKLYHNTM